MENFHTTRWSLVCRTGSTAPEQAAVALEELCAAYYGPVQGFVQAWARDDGNAEDLTQAFFEELLSQRQSLQGANPEQGRFRSYLLGAVKHFLLRQQQFRQAEKRGGGASADELTNELPAPELPPDEQFDKAWARAILDRALTTLETQYRAEDRAAHFENLKPWLTGIDAPQAVAASALGLSATAVKVAIHRLRQRFRDGIRHELSQTLLPHADVAEEMHQLLQILLR